MKISQGNASMATTYCWKVLYGLFYHS